MFHEALVFLPFQRVFMFERRAVPRVVLFRVVAGPGVS